MKEDITHIVNQYFPEGDWHTIDRQGSGMNNTTRFIEANDQRYVLRIYETHCDIDKVLYEHRFLFELHTCELPFKNPVPVLTPTGESVVSATNGKLAAMFHYIDGENPSFQDSAILRDFGMMVADLTNALAGVSLHQEPIYQPYYEIENTYPALGKKEIEAFCFHPPEAFADAEMRSALNVIGERIDSFFQELAKLRRLPHQFIHGDLNASNTLMNTHGKLIAILDFEFVAWDLRIMEVAVCLSDLIRLNQPQAVVRANIEAFLGGYTSKASVSTDELHALPTLLLLRRIDVFLHFLVRYRDGIDGFHVVKDQILKTHEMLLWLNDNKAMLYECSRR